MPSGAIATAMAWVEALHGRDGGALPEDHAAMLIAESKRWGWETITAALGLLIGVAADQLTPGPAERSAPGPNDQDLIHVLVPAVVTRMRRIELAEVPDHALPTVSGIVTAAALGQDPYAWRTAMGPVTAADSLVFCYTLWLLIELLDGLLGPGSFGGIVAKVLDQG